MASGHLLLSCAKRAATTKIDLFAYLWQLPCALCSLILMTLTLWGAYHAVIRNACEFALEDDATLSYAEEKQLQSVQEQIELLLPQQEQEQHHTMEQTM